jgi:hypothetical protein
VLHRRDVYRCSAACPGTRGPRVALPLPLPLLSSLLLLFLAAALCGARPSFADTSHAGWPHIDRLMMDKGPPGQQHTLRGLPDRHNELLGGYGDDVLFGGNAGDVMWGDYRPSGKPPQQTAYIYAGNGKNFIYANDTINYVWTGTNPATVVHAHFGGGVIHCQSPGVLVYLSHKSRAHYQLDGCRRLSYFSLGY